MDATWQDGLRCWLFGHLPGEPATEEKESAMTIPGEPGQRRVVIRIRTVSCTRCGILREFQPAGIVQDDGPGQPIEAGTMSTNTKAVDREGQRVFDLGNHSTALFPEGSQTVIFTAEALVEAAWENVRVIQLGEARKVTYGVDESGKAACAACAAWMNQEGIETVELVQEGCEGPWEAGDGTLSPDWTYLTPFRSGFVIPDPYTRRGEIYFSAT